MNLKRQSHRYVLNGVLREFVIEEKIDPATGEILLYAGSVVLGVVKPYTTGERGSRAMRALLSIVRAAH